MTDFACAAPAVTSRNLKVAGPITWLTAPERILSAYFFYTAVVCAWHRLPAGRTAAAALLPLAIWAGAWFEHRHSRAWSRVVRSFLSTGLILAAYWQLDWFATKPLVTWQNTLLGWDHTVLTDWGLAALIENAGKPAAYLLETAYLLLYTFPPLSLAYLWTTGRGHRSARFLTTFLLGTLSCYALLPHFPVISPRIAFPGDHLPAIHTAVRAFNTWMLDHLDISTGVFPSGHVAVAFSCAWGLWRAVPENRKAASAMFAAAVCVYVATIYGRYHYGADGLASICVTLAAWGGSETYDRLA